MGKRKIIEAAKKKGLTVESAEWVKLVGKQDSCSVWNVRFGDEADEVFGVHDNQYFSHTAEALEWIDSLEPLPPREEEE